MTKTNVVKCSCFSVHPVSWVIRFGEQADPNYFQPDPGCPVHGCGMTQNIGNNLMVEKPGG